ncbi:tetratricopeptide repeat protein [bacterium]|nr:tetratricopeptide repeat protein [bacterium]
MRARFNNKALSLTLSVVSVVGILNVPAPSYAAEEDKKTCGAAKFVAPQFRDKKDAVKKDVEVKDAEVKDASKVEAAAKEVTVDDEKVEADEVKEKALMYEGTDHWKKAKAYSSKWKWKLADVELRAAVNCVPDMKIAHRDYCLVALMQGHFGRSLAELLIVVGAAEPIALSEEQKEKLTEDASTVHYNEGVEYAGKMKWKEAIEELVQARNYDPADPVITRSIAFSYASENNFTEAEKYYKEAFDLDPTDPFARADYAFLLAKDGKEDQALTSMEEAVKLRPDVIALHVDLGWMAESKGNLDQAEEAFRKACDLEPKQSTLWVHLGNIYKKLGKVEEAKDAYKKALSVDPTCSEAKEKLSQC